MTRREAAVERFWKVLEEHGVVYGSIVDAQNDDVGDALRQALDVYEEQEEQ